MAEVFISYSRKDKDFVRALHDALTRHGRDAWVDWEDIPLTADWQREIYEAIEAADTFIFVISPDSVTSEVCALEVGHAVQYNKRLIPVYHRDVDLHAINPALRAYNFVYLREQDDFTATIQALIAALDTDLDYVKRHTRLLVRAIEWDAKKREGSYVLRGADLREAESWLASSANKQPDPGELHLQYIAASRQAAGARQRVTVGSLVAGIVVAVILAALAFYQSNVATNEANNRATAQAVAQNEADSNATAQSVAQTQAAIALSEADSRATAEAVALRSADEAQSQALAAAAQLALNEDDAALAIALGLESTVIDDPPPSAQRTLAEAAYRPGARSVILAQEEGVNSIALSSDGRMVAAAGCAAQNDKGLCSLSQITLWDAATSERIRAWEDDAGEYLSVAFSLDDRYLASGQCSQTDASGICIQGHVTLWNPQTGEAIQQLVGHSAEVNQVTFSRDGTRLASAGDDGLIIWDVETGSRLRQIVGTGRIRGADFSPDGRFIVAGESIQAAVYEVETGNNVLTYSSVLNQAVVYSPDGETIAIASSDADIVLIDALDGDEIRRFRGHSDQVNTLVFSDDGGRIVSGAGGVFGADRGIIVWDVETGVALEQFEGHGTVFVDGVDNSSFDLTGVTRALFTSDGQTIVSGGGDGTLRFWDVQNGAIIGRLQGGDGLTVNAISYSRDGRLIAAAGAQLDLQEALSSVQQEGTVGMGRGDVILWDATSGSVIQRFSGHPAPVFALAFSPDGQYLASGSAAGDVIIWKVPGGDIVHQMEGHSDGTWGITYSPDGRYLVSGGFIGELFVWDAATGDLIRRLEDIGQSEVLRDLFTVGPYLYARYNQDSPHALLKWNLETGALVSRLDIPDADMNTFAVSPDGSRLLVANYDGTLRLYDSSSGEPIGEPFVGHSGGVLNALNTVAFSPDGRYALSGGYDTTVILWDVASGQPLRRFRGHTGLISDLTFSPDGRTAISASGDGFVNLWRVDSLPELITWTYANRYVREVNCNERIQYGLSPACGSDAAFPTRTPYPTLTPTLTFTPSPTVDLTRTTATPTATITPTFTATPTATLTPSPTPTAPPEAAGALSLDALATEVAGLTPPVTPIIPRELPEGLQYYGQKIELVVGDELMPGGPAFMMLFSSDPNFSFEDPRQVILVVEMPSPYADVRAWANENPLLPLMNFQMVNGIEVATLPFTETDRFIIFVHEGRFVYLSVEGVSLAITEAFVNTFVPVR